VHWRGETAPLTGAFLHESDGLLALPQSMKTFCVHGWLIVEVEADDGTVRSAMLRWRRW